MKKPPQEENIFLLRHLLKYNPTGNHHNHFVCCTREITEVSTVSWCTQLFADKMKFSRKKKVNRYMQFFKNNYAFHLPYQLLIDGTFCLAALEAQVQLAEQLPKYFNCELKMLTTQCVVLEMEKLGEFIVSFEPMTTKSDEEASRCSHLSIC